MAELKERLEMCFDDTIRSIFDARDLTDTWEQQEEKLRKILDGFVKEFLLIIVFLD